MQRAQRKKKHTQPIKVISNNTLFNALLTEHLLKNPSIPWPIEIAFQNTDSKEDDSFYRINSNDAILKTSNLLKTLNAWDAFNHRSGDLVIPYLEEILVKDFYQNDLFNYKKYTALTSPEIGWSLRNCSDRYDIRTIETEQELLRTLRTLNSETNYSLSKTFLYSNHYRIYVSPYLQEKPFEATYIQPLRLRNNEWRGKPYEFKGNHGVFHATSIISNPVEKDKLLEVAKFDKPLQWSDICLASALAVAAIDLQFGIVDVHYHEKSGEFKIIKCSIMPEIKNSDIPQINQIEIQAFLAALPAIIVEYVTNYQL